MFSSNNEWKKSCSMSMQLDAGTNGIMYEGYMVAFTLICVLCVVTPVALSPYLGTWRFKATAGTTHAPYTPIRAACFRPHANGLDLWMSCTAAAEKGVGFLVDRGFRILYEAVGESKEAMLDVAMPSRLSWLAVIGPWSLLFKDQLIITYNRSRLVFDSCSHYSAFLGPQFLIFCVLTVILG